MKKLLLSLALGCAAFPAAAQPRGTTHEDVWLMRRLGEPAASPDGRWAVFSVTEPSYEKDATVSDLWIVPVDGSAAPRRLTSSRGSESGAAWSPDGTRLAFSAKREGDEVAQIYLLDMSGPGEAQRLTSLSTGASAPVWSPDGRSVAFESRVYPGAADDAANAEEKKRRDGLEHDVSAYDGFPVRYWDHWLDDRQPHLFVQAAEPGAEARDLLAGSGLAGAPGYAAAGDSLDAVWTPDGDALVFSATTSRDELAWSWARYDLYRVPATGGEPDRLTPGDGAYGAPVFSSDGRSLYCTSRELADFSWSASRVARLGWPGSGRPALVAPDFDRSAGGLTLAAGGETLYVTASDAGRRRVFSIPTGGGATRALNPESGGVYAGVDAAGTRLVARWESAATPQEIVRLDPATGGHVALTSFNAARAAELDRPPFREFWFTSSKGRRIHNWLALPPGFDETKRYPLVLQIHGGPHGSSLDAGHVRWDPHLLASPGYVVLMTDYTGSVGYGEAFARQITKDPLRTPGEELIEAADEALRRFPFLDPERQAATGASYGGHLVNWLQATTDRFRCLVGHAGLVSLEGQWASSDGIYHREVMNGGPPWSDSAVWRDQSPSSYADRFRTPILLTVGEQDYRVPLNQTLAAWSYVQRQQVPGRLLVFHSANHWIMRGADARYFWEEVHAWLARYLE